MRSLLLALCLLAPLPALADDVSVALESKPAPSTEAPKLALSAARAVKKATLTLTRDDGKESSSSSGAIRAGGKHLFPLDAPPGRWSFKGTLDVKFADGGEGSMPLDFEAATYKPLTLESGEKDFRADQGECDVRLSSKADRCEWTVWYEGQDPRRGTTRFDGAAVGANLTVTWPVLDPKDVLLKVLLTCHDTGGSYISVEHSPWKLAIPHEDVVFATGKSDVTKEEEGKLDRAVAEIDAAVKRYGKIVKIHLWVAGHTDTVGDPGSNRALSLARARSIAAALRKKGLRVPISYTGLGEDAPLVPTADETDEPKNRRAEYTLARDAPLRGVSWQAL